MHLKRKPRFAASPALIAVLVVASTCCGGISDGLIHYWPFDEIAGVLPTIRLEAMTASVNWSAEAPRSLGSKATHWISARTRLQRQRCCHHNAIVSDNTRSFFCRHGLIQKGSILALSARRATLAGSQSGVWERPDSTDHGNTLQDSNPP
jgi:hypothetical protein